MCSKSFAYLQLVKFTILLIMFSVFESAAGNCSRYGHSCWGMHGKRNGYRNVPIREQSLKNMVIPNWFLARMLQGPMDLEYMQSRDENSRLLPNVNAYLQGSEDVDLFKGLTYDALDNLVSDDPDDSFLKKQVIISDPKILSKRFTTSQ